MVLYSLVALSFEGGLSLLTLYWLICILAQLIRGKAYISCLGQAHWNSLLIDMLHCSSSTQRVISTPSFPLSAFNGWGKPHILRQTYCFSRGLEAVDQLAFIDQIRIALDAAVESGCSFSFEILIGRSVLKTRIDPISGFAGFAHGPLLHNTASYIFEIWRIARCYDIVRCYDGAWCHQSKLLTKLEVCRVGGLVMIQEQQVDVAKDLCGMQPLDGCFT